MPFPSVHPDLVRALTERGYVQPTPVQAAMLPPEAAGKDLLVSAQTGSGKTVAYGLALGSTLLDEAAGLLPAGEPLALVVAPTRELALQVHHELSWLYEYTGAHLVSCVGGMDLRQEQRALARGAHIVVGTPGRLRDHLERGHLDISQLRGVVLDEADEMLDLGFREDLEFILDTTPANRRTLLFSATIPKGIAALAKRYQRDAIRIATSVENEPHGDIEHRAVRIAPNESERAIVNLLRYFEPRGAMLFCSTRAAVRHLHANLLERGFAAVAISGDMSQGERTHALQALRDGRARVCVATDVAARGLDLPDLGLVLHADLPNDREMLLHRSGRTGRAGRKGTSVLLVPYTRQRRATQLLASANIDATWMAPPSADEIRARDQERLVRDAAFTEESTEEDLAAARALLATRSAEEVAAALVRMDRARLPAPEEVFDGAAGAAGAPAALRPDSENMAWFRMNVGRSGNADPRWLVPLICRRGHITKRDLGRIRIFDRETKFAVARQVVDRFASAVRRSDDKDAEIRIEAIDTAPAIPGSGRGRRPMAKNRSRPGRRPVPSAAG